MISIPIINSAIPKKIDTNTFHVPETMFLKCILETFGILYFWGNASRSHSITITYHNLLLVVVLLLERGMS